MKSTVSRRVCVPLIVLSIGLSLAACSTSGSNATVTPPTTSTTSPEVIASPSGPLDSNSPVSVPVTGAYVGAWNAPAPIQYNQQDRMAAVSSFEQQINRPLDIVHTYRKWDDPTFSDAELEFIRQGHTLLYSWAGTDTRQIVSGKYDTLIRQRADDVRDMSRPILMEWRWEMDRPNLRVEVWGGADYIAAWKHIRGIFQEERVTNASWVWCPTVNGFADGDAPDFYPGDDQVDWICVDAYPDSATSSMLDLLRPFLQWAAIRPKPVMIGEYGVPRSLAPADRAGWLRSATAMFRANPQIKAVLYFDGNPVGHKPAKEWVIHDDPAAMAAFKEMADDPYFNPDRLTLSR